MLDNLTRRLSGIFAGLRSKGRLNEGDVADMLREVRVALLEADVNFAVTKDFISKVKDKAVGEDIYGSLTADQTIVKIVRDELTDLLGSQAERFRWSSSPPTVVLLCGLQGSGKTTTCAKLAKWLAKEEKTAMMAACDVQRPAAIKQLEVLGEQVGVPVYTNLDGSNPIQIAQEALARCKHLMLDVLIVDTAGRLQVDEPLMQELEQIVKAVKPTEVFLVLDSTTGQEAVNVAKSFHERVPVTGAIFTKLDGDTRGGAVLSVKAATEIPVRFIGVGEQTDAIDQFYPDRMAQRILGMGDVLGIIEKAESAMDMDQAKDFESKMQRGNFDFEDMLSQFIAMRKMGPIQNMLKMVPGLMTHVSEEELNSIDDKQINRVEAIILSMTLKERQNPDIINGSRRKRLAAGSGTSVEEVNNLIKKFYEMRRSMKHITKLQQKLGRRGRRR